MKTLLIKILIVLLLLSVPQIILSIVLNKIDNGVRDTRQKIFSKIWSCDFQYALLGDSVFCSDFVDHEIQTLWKQIESKSGKPVFPGALDAAKPDDIIKASIYLGKMLKPGSVVFIGALPGRNWGDDNQSYKNKFVSLMGNYDYTWDKIPLSNIYIRSFVKIYPYKINREDIKYLLKCVTKQVPKDISKYYGKEEQYDRIWYRDGTLALDRYSKYNANKICSNFSKLDVISNVLLNSKLKPVFVLTPLNTKLIERYAPADSSMILSRFNNYRDSIRKHLENRNCEYLDLTDLVPSEGFADMLHTNALGDSLMSEKMASYIKSETLNN